MDGCRSEAPKPVSCRELAIRRYRRDSTLPLRYVAVAAEQLEWLQRQQCERCDSYKPHEEQAHGRDSAGRR